MRKGMQMQVLAIMGSPRNKGNSYRITKRIEEKMKSRGDVEFDYLFLRDAHLEPCRGCGLCLTTGEDRCPLKDDRAAIEKQMLSADGVIFVTPVYAMNVTALMKNFLDRFAYTFHRPRFFDQHAVIICTTGAVGLKETIDRMAVIQFAGFNLVHKVGFVTPMKTVSESSKEKIDKGIDEAAKKLYEAIESRRPHSPTLINLAAFRSQQASFQLAHEHHLSECDYNYFEEHGWFDEGRKYYVDAKVNPLKNQVALLIGRISRRNIIKDINGVPW